MTDSQVQDAREAKRRALVELRLRRAAGARPAAAPIPVVPRDGRLPLSYQQEGLWFLHQLDPASTVYAMSYAWRLHGPLDVPALRAALTALVRRHESLRTRFGSAGGRPYQIIDPAPAEFPLPLADGPPGAGIAPFDLERGPLFRAALHRLDGGDHVLTLTAHHIVADGWSFGILTRELDRFYRAGGDDPAPPPAVQPADVAAWQRGGVLAGQLGYWQRRLAGLTELALPTTRPRPAVRTWQGASLTAELPPGDARDVAEFARTERVSFLAVLYAAFAAVLARCTGQEDLAIGSVFGGRTRAELEPLVGYFASTVVLRTGLGGDPTFAEIVRRGNETVLEAIEHQDVPFAAVVDALKPERDPARNPLFQVSLAYQPGGTDGFRLGGLRTEALAGSTSASRFDLGISVTESADGGLRASVEYATELFDEDFVRGLVERTFRFLTRGVAQPGVRLSGLELVSPDEAATLLHDWNPPAATAPADALLGACGGGDADPAVVVAGGPTLTYGQLTARAAGLARLLRDTADVIAETIVGVLLDRGADLLVAQLGVLRAGGAWMPLDVSHPRQRWAWQCADAGVRLVLTTRAAAAGLPAGVTALCLDELDLPDADPPDVTTRPDNLAYVMYTSGSTGHPKGVQIPHRAAAEFASSAAALYSLRPGDRVLQFANPCFDVSIFDVFATLAAGATVVCAAREVLLDPDALTGLLRRERITVAPIPPAVLGRLDHTADLPDLRLLLAAGEACPAELVSRWSGPGREFHNGYGPTEVTVLCTDHLCTPGPGPVPIGRAMANHRAYILDTNLQPQPPGIPGELHITGTGLARGYLNKPHLTADRFIPDPHHPTPGTRMYRTGDLARWTTHGTLEFLGRTDRQIKIRGIRIEPAEIEQALNDHPHIRQTHVTTHQHQLIAYTVTTQPTTDHHLRTWLLERLPTHLIPAVLITMDAFPVNPNGKIDVPALPRPAPPGRDATAPPRTGTERTIAAAWAAVLPEVTAAGADDNFFALGGNSLQALQVIARIRDTLGVRLGVRTLYANPTLRELAAVVDGAAPARTAGEALVPLRGSGTLTPLFCVHAIGGSAGPYTPLTALLDPERPVWGLEAPGLHGEEQPHRIEDLAARYATTIRAVRPDGPVHLLGWSAGGLIALEIARLLGPDTASLTMLDTVPPRPGPAPGHAALLAHFAADLAAQAGTPPPVLDADALAALPEDERTATALAALEEVGLVPAALRAELTDRLRVFAAIAEAMAAYRPEPYGGAVTLLGPAGVRAERLAGWSAWGLPGLAYGTVPGTHYTMLRPPHLPVLAAELATRLAAR
ncbi:non-ribosomal peptide synthetase [Pseudosporangium ferrugineum]|uniref:Amino acid adenylation domain-containing protein n=1 Tax=Pseudosporangium ferrugineum TaxID=439699 RepID=A0A2T0RLF6_9ACTN|nr:non-ribosomal peptide synthetase [Pseudosporangium ferrugineum]PRY22029.1 amino acid adenylation domain-containing protein [Pseudosporangium ferrugineum]